MARNYKLKSKILGLGLALVAPLSLFGGLALTKAPTQTKAAESDYTTEWSDNFDNNCPVTANSFVISGTSQEGNTLASTWKAIDYNVDSVGMIIDVGSTSFNNNRNRYFLSNNPGKLNQKADNKILMINSKYSDNAVDHSAKRGYRSNEFTLKSNSYYKLSVDAMTTLDGLTSVNDAYGSIYLSGLVDEDGKEIKFAYEGFSGAWSTYNFFIATGDHDQNVTLDLYLGRSNTEGSFGAVFYDEIKVEQFSQNAFVADSYQRGYRFEDTYESTAKEVYNKFMVERLSPAGSSLMKNYTNYNFDFEKELSGKALTEEWFIPTGLNSSTAHAVIMDVLQDKEGFESRTGYPFVGNDLSYDITKGLDGANKQALALYTDKGVESTITVQNSQDIKIRAHGVYKISMMVKTNQISGSFYINLVENDKLYEVYRNDKGEKVLNSTNTPLKSGTSTGLSSNATNQAHNNYNEVSFYVKGRDLYDTNLNLQLALGNSTTPASGCVLVDNIKVEYASTSDAENADNYLNLAGDSITVDSTVANPYFNDTEVATSEFAYPLTAKNWTLTNSNLENDNTVGGVVYLYNDETYNEMYSDYDWATSYPGNPLSASQDAPNNVYMLHNGNYSYQSVKSSSYTLNANSYYNLTFDYFTLNVDRDKDTQLTVEIIDENNITLYKEKLASTNNQWSKLVNPININFHTALTSSHNVSVIFHLGTSDDKMIGTAYIDNVEFSSSTKEAFDAPSSKKIDLTDYMLNLDPNGTIGSQISNSPAYSFSVDNGESNSMVGGIISGKENEFGVEYEDGNLLVLASRLSPSTGTLKSNYTFSLKSGSYYKLTFTLRTQVQERPDADHSNDDKDHKCSYGVKVGLTNFELAENLISNDEFTNYTIIFYASSDATSNLQFSLTHDKHTEGSAYLSNIDFVESTQEAYNDAKEDDKEGSEKTLFASAYTPTADNQPSTPDDTTNNNGDVDLMNWILIPSLITSLAVIIAIVGWILRHIKIKKIEKIKQESYDRKISLNTEAILSQASKERDDEVEAIKKNISTMEEQKLLLEEEHKQVIKDARLNSKGKITKDTEKEFKTYANKLSRLQQKIDILKEQLAKVQTHEYLISIERRIASEETKRQKDLIKASENERKTNDKKNK